MIVVQAPVDATTSQTPTPLAVSEAPKPAVDLLSVEPNVIEPGQKAILRWRVSDARQVIISPGTGSVPAEGMREISAVKTTVYTLLASNSRQYSSAAVTLRVLPSDAARSGVATVPADSTPGTFESQIQDIYFDFEKFDLEPAALQALARNAAALREFFSRQSSLMVGVEGHTDEVGSYEYNLGLSDRRAVQVRDFLVTYGVSPDRLSVTALGNERPQCFELTPECQARNRRVHFAPLYGSVVESR